jgi:hypothetical protein
MKNIRIDYLYFYSKEKNDISLESCFYEIPMYSYLFALEVKKNRLENEDVFLRDMSFAVQYSKNVIKGRLPKSIESKVFFNSSVISYYYGESVLKCTTYVDNYYYIFEYYKINKKLPEDLHNFMLLGCLKNNEYCINYINMI